MAADYVPLTNLRGPAARIVELTATTLPPGSEATALMTGPDQGRTFRLGIPAGPRGLPGANEVPTDEAIGEHIAAGDETESGRAVRQIAAPVRKRVFGGVVPEPLRVPTLVTVDAWPNRRSPMAGRLLWRSANGLVLYFYGADASLYRSADGGLTWAHRAYLNWAPATFDAFLVTAAGSLLTISAVAGGHEIRRSTDTGATWTKVADLQAGQMPLGPQSWCLDRVNNHIYYGEYGGAGRSSMNLYRSTDDGATWPVFYAFPGLASTDPKKISHIHAVQWDHISQRVWICTGDSSAGTGLYRVNDDRTGVIPMVTNEMLDAELFDGPRAIGIMPFADYVAWASDSTNQPFLFRVARTELGKPNPVIERIYRVNSTSWWTSKASGDGSRWVFSASQEARTTHAIDKQVHLYAVEDQGATVYEVGAVAQIEDSLPAGSLQPVGLPEDQGEMFCLAARGTGRNAQWLFRLADAASARLDYPVTSTPVVASWLTVNSGGVTVPGAAETAFHTDVAASFARTLRIFDVNVAATDGSVGRIAFRIVDATTNEVLFTSAAGSMRQSGRKEWSPYVAEILLPANRQVLFKASNTHASIAVAGLVAATYGWGN